MEMNGLAGGSSRNDTLGTFTAALLMIALSAIILSLTPWTHDLVDVKTTIYLTTGPLLMILALALMAFGHAVLPPRTVVAGLAGYLVVMLLSVLTAQYKWAGWPQLLLTWSGAGFFMAGLCCGARRHTSEILLRYFVLILLIVNVIGFSMFSFPGAPPRSSPYSWLFKAWYDHPPQEMSPLFSLLYTLSLNDQYLISTFLGGDYYACFCLFYFPFALLMALDPGPVRYPVVWRPVGLAATITCAASVFYCRYLLLFVVWAIFLLVFSAVFFFAVNVPGSGRRAQIVGVVVLLVALIGRWTIVTPNLKQVFDRERYVPDHIRTVWVEALKMTADHPLLGGGPGSFRILFPSYRTPDYHLHQISISAPSTNNRFLDILVETGLLGFAAFLALVGSLLVPAFRWILRHPDVRMRGVLLAATAGVTAMLAANLVSSLARWDSVGSSLWMGMGFLGGLLIQAGRTSQLPVAGVSDSLPTAPSLLVERPARAALPRWIPHAALWIALMILPSGISYACRYFRSQVYFQRGYQAMASYDNPIPQDPRARNEMARQLQQSTTEFEAALAGEPTLLTAYYRLGFAWSILADIEEMERKDCQAAGREREAWESEAQVLQCLEKAQTAYQKLTTLAPDFSDVHWGLARVYRLYWQTRTRQAREMPSRSDLQQTAAEFEELTLRQMDRMSRLSTRKDVALFHGNTAMEMERFDRALAVFKAASDHYPEDKELAEKYLEAATKAGNTNAAEQAKERLESQK